MDLTIILILSLTERGYLDFDCVSDLRNYLTIILLCLWPKARISQAGDWLSGSRDRAARAKQARFFFFWQSLIQPSRQELWPFHHLYFANITKFTIINCFLLNFSIILRFFLNLKMLKPRSELTHATEQLLRPERLVSACLGNNNFIYNFNLMTYRSITSTAQPLITSSLWLWITSTW